MLLNRLTVFPTQETKNYFLALLENAPIEIEVNNFSVDIITTSNGLITKPNAMYSALAGTLVIAYDAAKQESSLILPLFSDSLTTRFDQLKEDDVQPYWYPIYNPHMVIKPSMVALKRRRKAFINSVSTMLSLNYDYLTFTDEMVVTEEQVHPVNYDYNVDCQSRA